MKYGVGSLNTMQTPTLNPSHLYSNAAPSQGKVVNTTKDATHVKSPRSNTLKIANAIDQEMREKT